MEAPGNNGWLWLVGTIISVLGTAYVSLRVAKSNRAATTESATIAPYEALARRVADLEVADAKKARTIAEQARTIAEQAGRIGALERDAADKARRLSVVVHDRDELVSYVRQLSVWMQAGAPPPPPPIPAHLHELLDVDAWEVATIVRPPDPGT